MAYQKGSEMLLKVDSTGSGNFIAVAGLTTKSLSLDAETVEVTNQDSVNKWRELLAGAGIKSAKVSGSGKFADAAADEICRGLLFAGTIRDWQVILPDFGTIEGAFQITSIQYQGPHDKEVAYTISLESAGELTWTADT